MLRRVQHNYVPAARPTGCGGGVLCPLCTTSTRAEERRLRLVQLSCVCVCVDVGVLAGSREVDTTWICMRGLRRRLFVLPQRQPPSYLPMCVREPDGHSRGRPGGRGMRDPIRLWRQYVVHSVGTW